MKEIYMVLWYYDIGGWGIRFGWGNRGLGKREVVGGEERLEKRVGIN